MSRKKRGAGQVETPVGGEMPPKLKQLAEELHAMLADEAEIKVLGDYDIGADVNKLVARKDQDPKTSLRQLTEYLSLLGRPKKLDQLQKVATAFEREFVRQEVRQPMANNRYLEIGHFMAIAHVESKGERAELLALARAQSLTPAQLRELVKNQGKAA